MKLLKIHRKYLINKINILLLGFILFIGIVVSFFCIKRLNSEYNWFDSSIATIEYYETILMYYKLIVINLMCFLWGNAFTKENNSYHLLITGYLHIKLKFILSKILLLFIITFILVFINLYSMSLIASICSNLIEMNKIFLELFVKIFFISIIYGLLSMIFTIIINNSYACFIAVGLFVLCELLSDNFSQMRIYYVFFPGLSLNNELCFGFIHLFLLIILFVFLGVLSYVYKK